MNVDLVVVGAGLFGLTIAERCAHRARACRSWWSTAATHIGGNAYSEPEPTTGIEVHRYGAHLFHTSNERVWEYVNRFTAFTGYQHRVYTIHRGEVFPLPINLGTINQFFRAAYSPAQARALIAEQAAEVTGAGQRLGGEGDLADRPSAVRGVHPRLHRQAVADRPEASCPPEVITRLPVRYTYDNRYFYDRYEGLPVDGYAAWLERMADHPRIEVRLGHRLLRRWTRGRQRGVGPGRLHRADRPLLRRRRGRTGLAHPGLRAWRCCRSGDFQGTPVMNYADEDVPYTRIHEFRHFHPERDYPTDRDRHHAGVLAVRRPGRRAVLPGRTRPATGTRSRATARWQRAEKDVFFGGRLGTLPVPRHAHGHRVRADHVRQPPAAVVRPHRQ